MTIRVAAALRCRRCNEVHYLNEDQLCLDCSDKAQEGTVSKPIYALPREERKAAAERYSDLTCVVEIRPFRDKDSRQNYSVTGRVIGVAVPNVGTFADQLIVRRDTGGLMALSLATVHSIKAVTGNPAGAAASVARRLGES